MKPRRSPSRSSCGTDRARGQTPPERRPFSTAAVDPAANDPSSTTTRGTQRRREAPPLGTAGSRSRTLRSVKVTGWDRAEIGVKVPSSDASLDFGGTEKRSHRIDVPQAGRRASSASRGAGAAGQRESFEASRRDRRRRVTGSVEAETVRGAITHAGASRKSACRASTVRSRPPANGRVRWRR